MSTSLGAPTTVFMVSIMEDIAVKISLQIEQCIENVFEQHQATGVDTSNAFDISMVKFDQCMQEANHLPHYL